MRAATVAIGVILGNGIWSGAALFSVGTLFLLFPTFFIAFKIIGGMYLIWLGLRMIRNAKAPIIAAGNTVQPSLIQT